MSRLYDLSMETTRLSNSANGDLAWHEQVATFDNSKNLKHSDHSERRESAEAAGSPANNSSVVSPERKPPIPQNGIVENTAFANSGKLHVDRRVPTISNIADQGVVEHYRRLRTKILQEQTTKPFRTLVVTSPSPEEGKTLTVLNLGCSFAMLPSFKVLLVDGDLRRGSLGTCLGMDQRPGLSNFIDGSASLQDVVLKCEDVNLYFVGRGNSGTPPAELLQSCELRRKINELAASFSLVLVDSPPANLITDLQLLAGNCDAVLLIARAFATTKKAFEKTVQDVSAFRVIGTVLNGATRTQQYRRYRGYY